VRDNQASQDWRKVELIFNGVHKLMLRIAAPEKKQE
jgi:predicted carbohydrate-binding protein with CBM5 and CBM33 domain